MHLAVVSDTHIPARAEAIPAAFRERIAAADHTIHAGDFETAGVLADLQELATEVTAVHGNADPKTLPLPAVDAVTLEDVTFVVTHGTVNPVEAAVFGHDALVMDDAAWRDAVADTARARSRAWTTDDPGPLVGIGGHSHEVVDTTHAGVRLLNPGSATGADPAETATMYTVAVADGTLDVTLHEA